MKSFKNSSLYLSLLCLMILFFVNSLLAQRVELVERRSIFSKTFRNPDNTLTAEISPGPVHFRDTDGSLQEINRNIVPSNTEFDFEVTQGFYHVYFKGDLQSDYPVVFESKDGANLKMKLTAVAYLDVASKDFHILQNVQSSTPTVSGSEIVFPNVFNDIDLKFVYKDLRLKEEIWMNQAARSRLPNPANFGLNARDTYLVFITKLDLDGSPMVFAKNTKIRNQEFEGHERITFRNLKNEIKFFLPVDWAFLEAERDSVDRTMIRMRRRMIHRTNGHFLLAGIKLSELGALTPGTVVFDPQVILPGTGEGKDTHLFFHNNLPTRSDNNFGGKDELWVYRDAYSSFHLTRPLLQFDLSGIPGNASISDATLELYVKRFTRTQPDIRTP